MLLDPLLLGGIQLLLTQAPRLAFDARTAE